MPSQHIAVLLQFCGVTSIACVFVKEARRALFESLYIMSVLARNQTKGFGLEILV